MRLRSIASLLVVAVISPRPSLASNLLQDGYYWTGTSGEMIEIQNDRIIVSDRPDGSLTPSEPQPINEGIFFYDDRYWCRSDIDPYNAQLEDYETVECTAKGWVSVKAKQPKHCEPSAYQEFFVNFVRGYDDQKNEIRNTYTGSEVKIANYAQPDRVFFSINKKLYQAFRLGLNQGWIYVDRMNRSFIDQEQTLNNQPNRMRLRLDVSFPDKSFVTRLKAREFVRLAFREISDRKFRVDYYAATYRNVEGAAWVEADEQSAAGAYVFEHHNGCWHLTQDLRILGR
ncbi:hypothetical protein NIES2135_07410 [Leptolyngbya boryana NIES-2135]|jgi:hypothetical protein|uniref:Uncharacterized protein n=1 Tax=Leptolyngbya boryana NIES-2135 TaxID=1973484 RepID=A0A1Z4JB74_LEPBY|nr:MULTISPECIES: hypothetical protein [Leptolyngbya]BAY53928.1 hypothetical protein NIES2135_07410 [Leptolyngbya boryana NIES-2135]MBD2371616.1 hypothetical protein [Leptolyngbya sp. FACHB-161]MBD2378166.1 hypothetical protein [Leptolyngbya sp. FACHB-238]MBD2402569.1 hypothetical protein [Leptolyngbya sp. FACHB-239]MBD2409095.1 hypothetical protein [Leptolyngbya sp. FACHB-402]